MKKRLSLMRWTPKNVRGFDESIGQVSQTQGTNLFASEGDKNLMLLQECAHLSGGLGQGRRDDLKFGTAS